jgi:hypothetical protein
LKRKCLRGKKAFEQDCDVVLAEYVEVDVNGERMLKNPALASRYTDTLEAWMKKRAAGEASKAARLAVLQAKQQPPHLGAIQ